MNDNQISQYLLLFHMSRDSLLDLEQNLNRCIERLYGLAKDSSVEQILPAFCFTGTLLDQYLAKQQNHMKSKYYYELFEGQFNKYRIKIMATPEHHAKFQKVSKQEILKEITALLDKHYHFKTETAESQNLRLLMKKTEDIQNYKKQLSKIRKFYEEHNIDDTCRETQNLYDKIKENAHMKQQLTKQVQEELVGYEKEYEKMLKLYSNFQTYDGWIVDKDEDNLKLQYKVYQQQRTIAVRVSSQIDIQMLPFLAIVCQIDLQKHYVPFVEISEQVKTQNFKKPRNLKLGYSLTSVPFLADRQCIFYAIGYDRMKTTGSIFMYTESFEDDQTTQKKFNYEIQNANGKVFLKVHYFCLDYKPINRYKAQVRFVTKADFKLSFLPLFILTASARIFGFNYFESIVEKAKKFKGSLWQEKVKSNPQMYNFFQQKIDEYFGKL